MLTLLIKDLAKTEQLTANEMHSVRGGLVVDRLSQQERKLRLRVDLLRAGYNPGSIGYVAVRTAGDAVIDATP